MASPADHVHHSTLSSPPPPPAHHQLPSQAHLHHHRQQDRQEEQHYPPYQRQLFQSSQQQQQQHGYGQQQPVSPATQSKVDEPQSRQHHPGFKSRAFSFHSDKTNKGHHHHHKQDLHETHEQKEARRLHSKADPTFALSEAEPSAIAAAMTQSSLAPLRSIQHKDTQGNPIADPDKSNPTRNRWERPLDTIRSFEAAIDGGYSRKSMMRADSVAWNRRSSFHPGQQPPRLRQDSYYSSRPVSFRPENTQFDLGGNGHSARSSYYEPQNYNHGGQYPGPQRQRASRMYTEPHYQQYGREPNGYHLSHKDRSYETVTSAAASGSSDQVGYQTDPTSSDNSSIERNSPAKRPMNDYGIGFAQPQSYQSPNFTVENGAHGTHPLPTLPAEAARQPSAAPVPRKEAPSTLRRQSTQQSRGGPEKRKSWFSRRFSKNS